MLTHSKFVEVDFYMQKLELQEIISGFFPTKNEFFSFL